MINYRIDKRSHVMANGLSVVQNVPSAAATNWWEAGGATGCLAAYQPKGAASYAASLTDLANPGTYDATEGVAPSWASGTGWSFNGSNDFLWSGIAPASGYSMIVRIANAVTGGPECICGSNDATTATRFFIHASHNSFSNSAIWGGGGVYTTYGSSVTSGVLALANQTCYVDGSSVGTTNAAWSGTSEEYIAIGARNSNSGNASANEWFEGDILALAIYDNTLDGDEIAAITTAMAAL